MQFEADYVMFPHLGWTDINTLLTLSLKQLKDNQPRIQHSAFLRIAMWSSTMFLSDAGMLISDVWLTSFMCLLIE